MSLHVEVVRHEASAESGIVTYYCRIVETDDKEEVVRAGPITGMGIDPEALANLGGDYETWIMSHAPTLVRQYKALQHNAEHAPQLKGKRFKVSAS